MLVIEISPQWFIAIEYNNYKHSIPELYELFAICIISQEYFIADFFLDQPIIKIEPLCTLTLTEMESNVFFYKTSWDKTLFESLDPFGNIIGWAKKLPNGHQDSRIQVQVFWCLDSFAVSAFGSLGKRRKTLWTHEYQKARSK